MTELPFSFEELIEASEGHDLYGRLIDQINKDLLLANIDLEFGIDTLPSSLKYILRDTVFHLINEKFIEYLNLLYIVDVSEDKIKKFDSVDMNQLSEEVTFLILQREWQKVWYKKFYSDS